MLTQIVFILILSVSISVCHGSIRCGARYTLSDWSSDNLNSEDSDALLEVTVDEGFDYVSDLLLLNDDNFKELGLKMGQRVRVQRALSDYRDSHCFDEELPNIPSSSSSSDPLIHNSSSDPDSDDALFPSEDKMEEEEDDGIYASSTSHTAPTQTPTSTSSSTGKPVKRVEGTKKRVRFAKFGKRAIDKQAVKDEERFLKRNLKETVLPSHSNIHAEYVFPGDWPAPDPDEFPDYYFAEGQEYHLHAGDMLYVPANWWHWVFHDGINGSTAVSYWTEYQQEFPGSESLFPVQLQGAAVNIPAFHKWTDQYLADRFDVSYPNGPDVSHCTYSSHVYPEDVIRTNAHGPYESHSPSSPRTFHGLLDRWYKYGQSITTDDEEDESTASQLPSPDNNEPKRTHIVRAADDDKEEEEEFAKTLSKQMVEDDDSKGDDTYRCFIFTNLNVTLDWVKEDLPLPYWVSRAWVNGLQNPRYSPDGRHNPDATFQANLWWSSGPLQTGLHYDSTDNTIIMVKGSKRLFLFGPEESDNLYPVEMPVDEHGNPAVPPPDEGSDMARDIRDMRDRRVEEQRGGQPGGGKPSQGPPPGQHGPPAGQHGSPGQGPPPGQRGPPGQGPPGQGQRGPGQGQGKPPGPPPSQGKPKGPPPTSPPKPGEKPPAEK